MKGLTNAIRINSVGYEKLLISLTSNQSTHSDITEVSVALNVEGGRDGQTKVSGNNYTVPFQSLTQLS